MAAKCNFVPLGRRINIVRPTKTREQMDYEFSLIKARIPLTRKQCALNRKRSRVIESG